MATVLIVDDNPMDRLLASGFVEQEGLSSCFAENGREAIKIIQSTPPDLVLTDLDMPELDGLGLVQEVKKSFPTIPVILMTAKGSEEVAATALRVGASSYVPKRNFQADLTEAIRIALGVSESLKHRRQAFNFLTETVSRFVLGYEPQGPVALTSYLQDAIRMMGLCDDQECIRVGTALIEALRNAIDHGNLELNSDLRDGDDPSAYHELAKLRMQESPYRERRVYVTFRLTADSATFSIRDQGPGFDPATAPDPTDFENLMRPHGRGLMLIQTFMDAVQFNETGNEITMVLRKKHEPE